MSENLTEFCSRIERGVSQINAKAEAEGYSKSSGLYVNVLEYLRPIYFASNSPAEKTFIESVFLATRKRLGFFINDSIDDLVRPTTKADLVDAHNRKIMTQIEYHYDEPAEVKLELIFSKKFSVLTDDLSMYINALDSNYDHYYTQSIVISIPKDDAKLTCPINCRNLLNLKELIPNTHYSLNGNQINLITYPIIP
ncbi:hypothetical protein [Photobacterium leiognathi]|uniref:hypothetical protein n=1 Tax=Photobacterium leiognathi TaxID=553611 RepID=UPI00298245BA|nr:hypothetical protein [Photobacterium leiognathi]